MWGVGPSAACLVLATLGASFPDSDFSEFLLDIKPVELKQKINDDGGDDLRRKTNELGTLPDADFEEITEEKVYTYDENHSIEDVKGGFFRSNGETRGSTKPVGMPPACLDHKADPVDPQGCGNPVCVIIDKKPRRFVSICELKKFLVFDSRLEQINFVQKGDCYDIIDNKDGAKMKPWFDAPKSQDCSACKEDEYCNGKVVFIVDISSFLRGESSGPGGPDYQDNEHGRGKMSAFPFEFTNICEAGAYFNKHENLNIKTQLVGLGFGDVVAKALSGTGGDTCLWTEWFDHDTPCNSNKEVEMHSEHFTYIQSSYTGAYRICQTDHMKQFQHQGGSEVTQIDAETVKSGNGVGSDGTKFSQEIMMSKTKIECQNLNQKNLKQLPPPFIYNDGKNNTCLDYKSRYCCNGKPIWRPQSIEQFGSRLPLTMPLGLAISEIQTKGDGAVINIKLHITDGKPDSFLKQINMDLTGSEPSDNAGEHSEGSFTGTLVKAQGVSSTITGKFTEIIKDDRSREVTLMLNSATNELGTIVVSVHSEPKVTRGLAVVIKANSITATTTAEAISTEDQTDEDGKKRANGEQVNKAIKDDVAHWNNNGILYRCTLNDILGGIKTITADTMAGEFKPKNLMVEGQLTVKVAETASVWEKVQSVVTEAAISTLVESPPMANLFHECEWRDWTNIDYPDKIKNLEGEFELRDVAANNTKLAKHVCGSQQEHAHYVDAVTMDEQIPWYELRVNSKEYETFKLTPYFGYACKDANGEGKFCKDMKIRYCCERKTAATWANWEEWSKCDESCGGGKKIRTRKCASSEKKSNHQKQCFGHDKERYTKQSCSCNVGGCPEDMKFKAWGAWSACTVSCGGGFKTRTRSCSPALNGGEECPNRVDNKELYEKTEQCTSADCEIFEASLWSVWSGCSVTCGKGVKSRERTCKSAMTFETVVNHHCSNDETWFKQNTDCLLTECPVDGGWTPWGIWGLCSQACITHPEGDAQLETKAFRSRERFCSDPIPKFGGKKCEKNPKAIQRPNKNGEEEQSDCFTELSKDLEDPNAVITPWCPQQCVYSEWGAWAPCSLSCVTINIKTHGDYSKNLKNLQYSVSIDALPSRTRFRTLMQEAKYNGECPEKMANYDIPGSDNGTLIFDVEECKICPEHCLDDTNPSDDKKMRDIRNMPALEYPGDDPSCVGFCGAGCSQTEERESCEELAQKYFDDDNDMLVGEEWKELNGKKQGCFIGEFRREIWDDVDYNEMQEDMIQFLKKFSKEGKYEDFSSYFAEVGAFEEKYEEIDYPKIGDALGGLNQDIRTLKKMKMEVTTIRVKEPNFDGLFGGEHCMEVHAGDITRTISSNEKYLEDEAYSDKPKYARSENTCAMDICGLINIPEERKGGATGIQECLFFRWSAWGEPSKCSEKCGDEGTRTRTRECKNTCTGEVQEGAKQDKCTPYVDFFKNKTWTDSYTIPCTPCPPGDVPAWSTWSSWAFDAGTPGCYKEGENGEITRSRERICSPIDGIKCSATPEGLTEGADTQTQIIPRPPCTPAKRR